MTEPKIAGIQFTDHNPAKPLLVLGPGIGTAVEPLWGKAAQLLANDYEILGYDLPGHGRSEASTEQWELDDLANIAARLASEAIDGTDRKAYFAGVSLSGAVAQRIAANHGDVFERVAMVCSSPKFGTPEAWQERAEYVSTAGTPAMVERSAKTWFAEGFIDAHPTEATALLHSLQNADRHSYAHASIALSHFDMTDQLAEIQTPLLALVGEVDPVSPPEHAENVAATVQHGQMAVLENVAHQAPTEDPEGTAQILHAFFSGQLVQQPSDEQTTTEVYDAGMAVRRQVLSDGHVDRANANTDDFTRDFQEMITRYAWGTIWTRPGLDRRMRSAVTLTAMVAGKYWDELAMHVKAARRNGLSVDEIKEILLQTAIYCSVPAANVAFSVAKQALAEYDTEEA